MSASKIINLTLCIIAITSPLLFMSCTNREDKDNKSEKVQTEDTDKESNKKRDRKHTVGKYFYIRGGVVHVDGQCVDFLSPTKDEDGVVLSSGRIFLERSKLKTVEHVPFCYWCVDEETYEYIKEIVEHKVKKKLYNKEN